MDNAAVPTEQVRAPIRVWTVKQITTASAFGGIIGGCILLSQNAALLGRQRQAKWLIMMGVALTVLWATIIICLPSVIVGKIPDFAAYWIPAIAIWQYARATQRDSLEKLLDAGATKRPFGKLILWALLSTAGSFVLGIVIYTALLYLVPALVLA